MPQPVINNRLRRPEEIQRRWKMMFAGNFVPFVMALLWILAVGRAGW